MSLIFALLISCSLIVQAHVSMSFADDGGNDLGNRPIRNANSVSADGQFSTAGPCGGVETFGGAGGTQISSADPGDVVTMKIQYNGGHKSPDNQFTVRWACGTPGNGPTEATMLSTDPLPSNDVTVLSCPVPGQYPCMAPDGNDFTPGYIMSVEIPTDAANMDCSFSMIDQRDWGGCVDIEVSRNVDGVEVLTLSDVVGEYPYRNTGVNVNSALFPNCCCTMDTGSLTATVASDSINAVLDGTVQFSCPEHELMTLAGMADFEETINQLVLTKDDNSFSWRGETTLNGQTFEFLLRNQILYYTNTDSNQPMICDGEISHEDINEPEGNFNGANNCASSAQNFEYSEETNEFIQVAGFGNGDSGDGGVGAFPFVIMAVVLVACAVGYASMFKKEKEKEQPTFTMPSIA